MGFGKSTFPVNGGKTGPKLLAPGGIEGRDPSDASAEVGGEVGVPLLVLGGGT